MSVSESVLVWIVSFLIFLAVLYLAYKVSYKLGIKKALYRTTYILLSIIFAFAITPFVTNELFNYDLTKFGIALKYKEKSFTTVIDYLEEVIVHSEFLNDLYAYFPSLKDLFMDFPQVLIAPIMYVALFLLFMIIWLPLYLYLSYKRKRRILYDREDNKAHRVWAGILGAVQVIFITSVVLSPINGLNRIYHAAIDNTLDDEYDSLCDGNPILEEYKTYCDILHLYDSTVFATIGDNKSISDYTFDSLTRIQYDGGYTTLSQEASLIIKSSIVLNQSGLIDVISNGIDTIPIPLLMQNEFSEENIDIIVDTLSNSKYSQDLLVELEEVTFNTLNDLISQVIQGKELKFETKMTSEEAIEEIKIVLKVLPMLVNTTLIRDVINVKDHIEHFVYEVPENIKKDRVVFKFLVDMFDMIDLDDFEMAAEYLFESKIVNDMLPLILNTAFGKLGFDFTKSGPDIIDQFYNFMDFAKLMKKYKPVDFFDFIQKLDDEEMMLFGDVANYLCMSQDSIGFVRFLFATIFKPFEYHPIDDIIAITDWTKEVYVIRDICIIVEGIMYENDLDIDRIWKVWNNKESEAAAIGRDIILQNKTYISGLILKALEK